MTEAEWLASEVAYQPLIHVRKFASVRKLRLVAAAYVRWLQSLPEYEEDRPCADVIEEVADGPLPREELELRLYGLPGGGWRLSHTLGPEESVGQAVNRLVAFTSEDCGNPAEAHRRILGLLSEIFGNPFRPVSIDPAWLTANVCDLAQAIYDERAFDRLPILADALLDAGCDSEPTLSHCRSSGPHVRGCWVVDLILGKC